MVKCSVTMNNFKHSFWVDHCEMVNGNVFRYRKWDVCLDALATPFPLQNATSSQSTQAGPACPFQHTPLVQLRLFPTSSSSNQLEIKGINFRMGMPYCWPQREKVHLPTKGAGAHHEGGDCSLLPWDFEAMLYWRKKMGR